MRAAAVRTCVRACCCCAHMCEGMLLLCAHVCGHAAVRAVGSTEACTLGGACSYEDRSLGSVRVVEACTWGASTHVCERGSCEDLRVYQGVQRAAEVLQKASRSQRARRRAQEHRCSRLDWKRA